MTRIVNQRSKSYNDKTRKNVEIGGKMTGLVIAERLISLFFNMLKGFILIRLYGEYKCSNKKAAWIFFGVGLLYSYLFWFVNIMFPDSLLNTILLIIGICIFDVLYIILAKGRWYINIMIIEIFFVIDGVFCVIYDYVFQVVFEKEFSQPMIYHSWNELLCCEMYFAIVIIICSVICAYIMKKIFPFEKMHHDVLGNSIYWGVQLVVNLIIQTIYYGYYKDITFTVIIGHIILVVLIFVIIHLGYTMLKRLTCKYQSRYIDGLLEIQKNFYEDIYASYEETRNLRHDIMKHIRNMELLDETDKEIAKQYEIMIHDKINRLNQKTEKTIIRLVVNKINQKEEYQGIEVSVLDSVTENEVFEILRYNDVVTIVKCMLEIGMLNSLIRNGTQVIYCVAKKEKTYRFVVTYPATKKVYKMKEEQKHVMKDAKKVLRYVANKEGMSINIFKEKEVYRMEVRTDEKRRKEK